MGKWKFFIERIGYTWTLKWIGDDTDFELHNDGGSITSNCWKVTWYEDYVEVILSGKEQFDEQVILYFDGTKEIQQLTDIAVDYPSGEELDESRVITEQSFDMDLNDWGEVRFVSYWK